MSYSIEVQKSFPVMSQMIYDAWLDPNSIKVWFSPGMGVKVPNPQLHTYEGGDFQFDMENDGELYRHEGVYKTLDRPNKIQFTWKSNNTNNKDTLVTIDIKSIDEKNSELTLKHEDLPSEESADSHKAGWSRILDCLAIECTR